MRASYLVGLFVAAALLSGCEAAFETHIGSKPCDSYRLEAIATTFNTADDNFLVKAKKLCPKGYTVLQRRYDGGEIYAKIECDCPAKPARDKSPQGAVKNADQGDDGDESDGGDN